MTRNRKWSWLAIFTALFLAVFWGCTKPQQQVTVAPEETQTQEGDGDSATTPATAREDADGRDEAQTTPNESGEQAAGGPTSGDRTTASPLQPSATEAEEPAEEEALAYPVQDLSLPYDSAALAPESAQSGAYAGRGAGGEALAEGQAGQGWVGGLPGADLDRIGPNGELMLPDDGIGPGVGGNQYDHVPENPFVPVAASPLSTFSIDVDTASYSNARMYLMQYGQLPPPAAVRIEEFINYFNYNYEDPTDEHPFSTAVEVATCPWQPAHRLVRVGLQGEHIDFERRPQANLVFLLDVSGSMDDPHKLPLVKDAIRLLVGELNGDDRVAIVVYAGAAGLVLDSTELVNGQEVLDALERLQAGGSTNGGAGLQLAYQVARDNFVADGINRIILCTDGDFNVGETSTGGLVETAVAEAKDGIFLSVLGFGMGNYNDAMLESISNNANGNAAFIDTQLEARKVMVEQVAGTLITIAKDVKIQVEFNPAHVYAYRLIGYENRILRTEDFTDDKKDAGEIGAGHQVTAIYEIVPVGAEDTIDLAAPEELRYQQVEPAEGGAHGDELLTVKLRYKLPDEDVSIPLEVPVIDGGQTFGQASEDFRFAASVAAFGMLLRGSEHAGNTNYEELQATIRGSLGEDPHGYRGEFLRLVGTAQALSPGAAPGPDAPESGWEVATEEATPADPLDDLPSEETAHSGEAAE